MRYRRRIGSDTWHFCTNCTEWPTQAGSYVEQSTRPTTGEFCNQCLAKQRDNNCR